MLAAAQASPARFQPAAPGPQAAASKATPSPLAALATPQTVAGGQTLFQEGDEAAALFEVTGGAVRLCRVMADGRRSITGFAFAGSILGLPLGETYAYTAEAVTVCALRRYPRGAIGRLLQSDAAFGRRMLAIVSDELSAAQDQMLLLGRKSAVERVASFLFWVARKTAGDDRPLRHVELPMSRTDVADYLGLTTETVSREMTKLRQAGVIGLPTPQRVEFLRPQALEQIAEEGEAAVLGRNSLTGARWPS